MARRGGVSRAGWVLWNAIRVVINTLAPASSTKDAAICVTAKARWRRLVLLVMRTLPLARFMPFDALADGRRGTNPKITAATIPIAPPPQPPLNPPPKPTPPPTNPQPYTPP